MSETVKTLQRALDRMDPSLAGTPAALTHEDFIKSGLNMCIRRSNESILTSDGVPDCELWFPALLSSVLQLTHSIRWCRDDHCP